MTIYPDPLSAKVAAVNLAHAEANRIAPLLRAALAPWVGRTVLRKDGMPMSRVLSSLPEFPRCNGLGVLVYHRSSTYSLDWMVKSCLSYQSPHSDCQYASYYETWVSVGRLRGGILTELIPWEERRTDYDVAVIRALQEAAKAAERARRDAVSALCPFAEND